MFNLSTQEVVLSIEKAPLKVVRGIIYQEYPNFFGNNYELDFGKKENFFFEGKVNYKENLGSDIYLHVNLKDSQQNFIARSVPEKAFNLKIDDSVRIGYMIDKLLVFKKNGQSIPLQL